MRHYLSGFRDYRIVSLSCWNKLWVLIVPGLCRSTLPFFQHIKIEFLLILINDFILLLINLIYK